jgi:hypothetical protein
LNNSKIHVFLLEDHALLRTSRNLIRKNKNKKNPMDTIEMKSVFSSVIVDIFQIVFHAEIYVNDFFYFLKIIFDIKTI